MIRRKHVRGTDRVKVTFVLPAGAPTASVVGDFNDWDPRSHQLKRRSNQTFSVSVELPCGACYTFRYLAEGGHWFNDDEADAQAPNEFGGVNSILIV